MRALLEAALLTGCALDASPETAPAAGSEASRSLVVSGIDWTLRWDTSGTERVPEGRRFTTDQGHVVTLTAGFVATSAVTLDPCEAATVTWLDLVGVGTAQAHHGEFEDPSLLELQWGEDLVDPADRTTSARFDPGSYCGVHWSIARPGPRRLGWQGNAKARISLSVSGTWTRGDEGGDFAWQSRWSDGQARALGEEVAPPARDPDGIYAVVLDRDLASLLDGIDLAVATEDQATWAILENLVGSYRAEITPSGS